MCLQPLANEAVNNVAPVATDHPYGKGDTGSGPGQRATGVNVPAKDAIGTPGVGFPHSYPNNDP